ncbi:MAG: HNH endonuclease [Alphaproteobacteria bacterium]|nr:HNH endonuclease [Alphaproteobacteria bacterium]
MLTTAQLDALREQLRQTQCGKCYYCKAKLAGGGDIEHMTPLARGGTNMKRNLVLACFQCNREKHAKTVDEYRLWRQKCGMPVRF